MKINTILIIFFTLFITKTYTQVINSNKTTVAQFYDGKVKTFELNGAKITGQFKIGFLSDTIHYDYKKNPETVLNTNHNPLNTVILD